jgi:four helix bundle protein
MQRFTNLKVWKRSHALLLEGYNLTKAFPSEEPLNLTVQLRRAVLSVPANIAEGSKRRTGGEYAWFPNYADGSLSETEYLLIVARDLGCLSAASCDFLVGEISEIARMLYALRVKVLPARGSSRVGPSTVNC